MLVTIHPGTSDILAWDLMHGRLLRRIPTGHSRDGSVYAITTDKPDGSPLAITASRFDNSICVLDLTAGHPACRPLEFPDRPTALAITPQRRLVVGFGQDVALLEPLDL